MGCGSSSFLADKPTESSGKSSTDRLKINKEGRDKHMKDNGCPISAQECDISTENHSIPPSSVYEGVFEGLVVLCRDEFVSKYTGEPMFRWRKAEIVLVQGHDRNNVLVHYMGWADTFDHWVDLDTEWERLAPIALLSKDQCNQGAALDKEQSKLTQNYFLTGKLPFIRKPSEQTVVVADNNSITTITTEKQHSYEVGQKLDVLDIYYKRGADIPSYRWRSAEVSAISGSSHITIHYLNWDSKYDETLHVVQDSKRIAAYASRAKPPPTSSSSKSNRNIGGASRGTLGSSSDRPGTLSQLRSETTSSVISTPSGLTTNESSTSSTNASSSISSSSSSAQQCAGGRVERKGSKQNMRLTTLQEIGPSDNPSSPTSTVPSKDVQVEQKARKRSRDATHNEVDGNPPVSDLPKHHQLQFSPTRRQQNRMFPNFRLGYSMSSPDLNRSASSEFDNLEDIYGVKPEAEGGDGPSSGGLAQNSPMSGKSPLRRGKSLMGFFGGGGPEEEDLGGLTPRSRTETGSLLGVDSPRSPRSPRDETGSAVGSTGGAGGAAGSGTGSPREEGSVGGSGAPERDPRRLSIQDAVFQSSMSMQASHPHNRSRQWRPRQQQQQLQQSVESSPAEITENVLKKKYSFAGNDDGSAVDQPSSSDDYTGRPRSSNRVHRGSDSPHLIRKGSFSDSPSRKVAGRSESPSLKKWEMTDSPSRKKRGPSPVARRIIRTVSGSETVGPGEGGAFGSSGKGVQQSAATSTKQGAAASAVVTEKAKDQDKEKDNGNPKGQDSQSENREGKEKGKGKTPPVTMLVAHKKHADGSITASTASGKELPPEGSTGPEIVRQFSMLSWARIFNSASGSSKKGRGKTAAGKGSGFVGSGSADEAGDGRLRVESSSSKKEAAAGKTRGARRGEAKEEQGVGSGGAGVGSNDDDGDGEDEEEEEEITEAERELVRKAAEEALRERAFLESLEQRGLHVFEITGDGNCLFRAVSHQLYLDQDMHEQLRARCVEHLLAHRKRFELFCVTDFDEHVKQLAQLGTWGDDLEIRALEEICDRVIIIYSSDAENVDEPINNNFEECKLLDGVSPITLSYHGQSHYNSIYDERYRLPLVARVSRTLQASRMALCAPDGSATLGSIGGTPIKGGRNPMMMSTPGSQQGRNPRFPAGPGSQLHGSMERPRRRPGSNDGVGVGIGADGLGSNARFESYASSGCSLRGSTPYGGSSTGRSALPQQQQHQHYYQQQQQHLNQGWSPAGAGYTSASPYGAAAEYDPRYPPAQPSYSRVAMVGVGGTVGKNYRK